MSNFLRGVLLAARMGSPVAAASAKAAAAQAALDSANQNVEQNPDDEAARLIAEQAKLDAANADQQAQEAAQVAAAAEQAKLDAAAQTNARLDSSEPFADQWVAAHSQELAASAVLQWAETDDLGEGEGFADRLLSLLVGAVDEDIDGELSDEEQDDLLQLADAAAEYLSSLGVSDDDLDALLNEWDNDAGERVQELVAAKLGNDADASDFVFGDGSDEAALDAVYKRTVAVRKGKKVRINKRVSGTVRLSSAQKVAVAKMRRKSNTGIAKLRRAKSMRVRAKMGI